jgi:hypothetical protein
MLWSFRVLQIQYWDLHWEVWRLSPWSMVYDCSPWDSQRPSTGDNKSSTQACASAFHRRIGTGGCRHVVICRCWCSTVIVLPPYRRSTRLLYDPPLEDHSKQQHYARGHCCPTVNIWITVSVFTYVIWTQICYDKGWHDRVTSMANRQTERIDYIRREENSD